MHFPRFQEYYGNVDFDTYLKGDLRQKRFHGDIYSRIMFMNEWGDIFKSNPGKVHAVKYEDICTNPEEALKRICASFKIDGASDLVIKRAVQSNTKDVMSQKPTNPKVDTTVVRMDDDKSSIFFTQERQDFVNSVCQNYLKHNFAYDYPTVS